MAEGRPTPQQAPLSEWIAAAIGLVLVAGVLLFLAWEGWRSEERPPAIALTVESVERSGDSYLVRLAALNTGDRTAAQVEVEARLLAGGESVEASRMTFDYLPPGSTRRGGMYFGRDPRGYRLEVRAQGYRSP